MTRYDKLIQNYELGGLKLIDLPMKDLVMKTLWINRARNN